MIETKRDGRRPRDDTASGAAERRAGASRTHVGAAASSRPPRSRRRAVDRDGDRPRVALSLALGIRAFVFQAYFVPSSSMVPTLQVGDRILVDKFVFNYHSVHAGDIVVFRTPAAATRLRAPTTATS